MTEAEIVYAMRHGGYGIYTLHELTKSQWENVFSKLLGWKRIDEDEAKRQVRSGIDHDIDLKIMM